MEQRRSIMMPAALTGSGRPPVPELSVLPLNSLPVISSLPPFTAHNGANVAAALSIARPQTAHHQYLLLQLITLISGEGNELFLLCFCQRADTSQPLQRSFNANVSEISIWLQPEARCRLIVLQRSNLFLNAAKIMWIWKCERVRWKTDQRRLTRRFLTFWLLKWRFRTQSGPEQVFCLHAVFHLNHVEVERLHVSDAGRTRRTVGKYKLLYILLFILWTLEPLVKVHHQCLFFTVTSKRISTRTNSD